MGELFRNLCKGPVVIVDDQISVPESTDQIHKLIARIEKQKLPVIKYASIEKAKNELEGLIFSNFVVLDWKFDGSASDDILDIGITAPESKEEMQAQENIDFINSLQKICLAPIFIISNFDKETIEYTLHKNGILKAKNNSVFVEQKSEILNSPERLIQTIEKWIENNPHVYLAKWWTNEWLKKNTSVFWDLYHSAPNWPNLVYKTLKDDGGEPVLGLIEMLSQLVYSEICASSLIESPISVQVELDDLQSLKNLYKRLVYSTNDIGSDIKPGDIFKIGEEYFLNIRPECDTTSRTKNPELYLLKGKKSSPDPKNFDEEFGIIEKPSQIILLQLDGEDVVVFNKRKLEIKKHSEIKGEKLCRVVHPYITKIRQSFISYIGRFGTPAYPKEILKEIFAPDPGEKMDL